MTDITVAILENIRADIASLREHFEGRFDALDERIDRTNERIDRTNERIERTNDQLESLVNLMGLLARNHGSLEMRVETLEQSSKA